MNFHAMKIVFIAFHSISINFLLGITYINKRLNVTDKCTCILSIKIPRQHVIQYGFQTIIFRKEKTMCIKFLILKFKTIRHLITLIREVQSFKKNSTGKRYSLPWSNNLKNVDVARYFLLNVMTSHKYKHEY